MLIQYLFFPWDATFYGIIIIIIIIIHILQWCHVSHCRHLPMMSFTDQNVF